MSTVISPTDFSAAGRNATVYASQLASSVNSELLLLHVYNLPLSLPGEVPGAMMLDLSQLEKDVTRRLKEEADHIAGGSHVKVRYKVIAGFISDEILEAEKAEKPEYIVMGIAHAGSVEEFVFGSSSTDVLTRVHTPMIIVPENAIFKKPARIVLAVDDKAGKDFSLPESFMDFIRRFNSKIYVLHVNKEGQNVRGVAGSEDGSESIREFLKEHFHSYNYANSANIIEGLNEFISSHDIDMIVMLPHKHNLFSRLFREGTTRKMAFHTQIPLMTISGH